MAYAFDKIKDLVGEDAGSDIFGGQEGGEGGLSLVGDEGATAPKTTTEGDVGGAAPVSETTAGSGEDASIDKGAVVDANVGKTTVAPKGIQGIQYQIDESEKALQSQADEYTTNYQNQYQFDMENDALDRAITDPTGSEDYNAARDLLSYDNVEQTSAGGAEKFGDTSSLYVDDSYLNSDAGLEYLNRQGQGPQYTEGMGAFDLMLMKRDPNFQNMINEIQGENRALTSSLDASADQYEGAAAEYGASALGTAQEGAEKYLGDYSTNLIAENQTEADAYDTRLAGLDKDVINRDAVGGVDSDLNEQLTTQFGGDRYRDQYDEVLADYDPSSFVSYNTKDHGYEDFLDEGESQRLNRVAGLLGNTDIYTQGQALGDDFTVDKSGLRDDLFSQVQTARTGKDATQRELFSGIEEGARGRAGAEGDRISDLIQNFETNRGDLAQSVAQEQGWAGLDPLYNEEMLSDYKYADEINPELFTQNLGFEDMLTADEASQLTGISADLGDNQTYTEGAGGAGGQFLDRNRMMEFLQPLIDAEQTRRGNIPAASLPGGGDRRETDPTVEDKIEETAMEAGTRRSKLPIVGTASGGADPYAGANEAIVEAAEGSTGVESGGSDSKAAANALIQQLGAQTQKHIIDPAVQNFENIDDSILGGVSQLGNLSTSDVTDPINDLSKTKVADLIPEIGSDLDFSGLQNIDLSNVMSGGGLDLGGLTQSMPDIYSGGSGGGGGYDQMFRKLLEDARIGGDTGKYANKAKSWLGQF